MKSNNISLICKENCCGCSGCKAICPKHAISMEEDDEGFLYPKVNDNCINCGLCLKLCNNKYNFAHNNFEIKAYAAKNNNKQEILKSSSGGISKSFCNYFLKNNGVVYGVVYNENNEVIVEREDNINGIEKLYGSKYVWANPKDSFEEVFNDLKNNKLVLFISTSCFVAGLKSFLTLKKCNMDKLYTIDLICHGTPSPRLFKDYIKYLKDKYNFKGFNFRTKKKPWGFGSKNFGCTIYQKNGKEVTDNIDSRIYLKLFFSNYALRPHCHKCEYTSIEKPSDITIADYWGIIEQHPDFYDDKGVSAVIIHSKKGDELFKHLQDVSYIESSIEKIRKKQPNLEKPSPIMEDRDKFWNLYYKKGFKSVCRKYADLNIKTIIKKNIKRILSK